MSRPIAETPILFGEDAKRFVEKMKYNEEHPASKEEYERVMTNYIKLRIDKYTTLNG
jgi:hypothetical protein